LLTCFSALSGLVALLQKCLLFFSNFLLVYFMLIIAASLFKTLMSSRNRIENTGADLN
jgi:hypothetical protein